MKWFWEILIAVDQLLNAILGGSADETISSRCGKRLRAVKAAGTKCYLCGPLCWLLDKIDPGHCDTAIEADEGTIDGSSIHPARRL